VVSQATITTCCRSTIESGSNCSLTERPFSGPLPRDTVPLYPRALPAGPEGLPSLCEAGLVQLILAVVVCRQADCSGCLRATGPASASMPCSSRTDSGTTVPFLGNQTGASNSLEGTSPPVRYTSANGFTRESAGKYLWRSIGVDPRERRSSRRAELDTAGQVQPFRVTACCVGRDSANNGYRFPPTRNTDPPGNVQGRDTPGRIRRHRRQAGVSRPLRNMPLRCSPRRGSG